MNSLNKMIIGDLSCYMGGTLNTEHVYTMLHNAYNDTRLQAWNECGYVKQVQNVNILRFSLTEKGVDCLIFYRL